MFSLIASTLMFHVSFSQTDQIEMASNFRGEGKIYVVIAVILIILGGIIVTLFRLERKLKRMEKNNNIK
jgi:hypothetical protein